MKITVYGPGCARCKQTEEIVRRVVGEIGAEAEVEKVTGMREMAQAGVMSTPAVAVEGVIKLAGRVPTPEEIKRLLVEAGGK